MYHQLVLTILIKINLINYNINFSKLLKLIFNKIMCLLFMSNYKNFLKFTINIKNKIKNNILKKYLKHNFLNHKFKN